MPGEGTSVFESSSNPASQKATCKHVSDNRASFTCAIYSPAELQELFFRTLGEICTQKHGINIGVWGDGISK